MGFTHPASGYLWKSELHQTGVELNKKNYSNPAMEAEFGIILNRDINPCLLYTSPSPRDGLLSRMPSSA